MDKEELENKNPRGSENSKTTTNTIHNIYYLYELMISKQF